MQSHDEEAARSPTFRQSINTFLSFAQAVCKPLEALFRRLGTPGEIYLGGAHAAIGLILMMIFITLADGPYARLPYGGIATTVVAVALIAHRLERFKNERAGTYSHSLSPGKSWIPGPDYLVQGFLEPALAIGSGILLKDVYIGLGNYLVLAGIALAINGQWQNMGRHARARATRDAYLEQMALRNGFGGRG